MRLLANGCTNQDSSWGKIGGFDLAITSERQELAATFRKNFRRLLSHHWTSQRELADAVDARYKWVRRLAHEGIVDGICQLTLANPVMAQ